MKRKLKASGDMKRTQPPGGAFFSLPWPPSVNHYWARRRNGGVYLTAKARAYRVAAWAEIKRQRVPQFGKQQVQVQLLLTPPDRRRRDIDNVRKPIYDVLEHAGVLVNDSQIVSDHAIRVEPEPPGNVHVTIRVMSVAGKRLVEV